MRHEHSDAIVLQTWPARERDKLVAFLTPDRGVLKGWAYGARSLKSRFGASLEPLTRVHFKWVEREGDEVVRLESSELTRSLFDIHRDPARSAAASYLLELVTTFAQPEEASELLYRLTDRASEALLNGCDPLAVTAYVDIWTLRISGVLPSPKQCCTCERLLSLPLRLDPSQDGFSCPDCAGPRAEVIPNVVSDLILRILREPVEQFAASGNPPDALLEVRHIAKTFRRTFLGHDLKTTG